MLHIMLGELRYLRPVGNPISTQSSTHDHDIFNAQKLRLFQSGTAALAAAIIAVKTLQRGKTSRPEILLPAYACPDLISACIFAEITPVLVDLESESCWMSLDNLAAAITQNTIGIIAVRFLGISERMSQLKALCIQHNLVLIEDSAQGFPSRYASNYWQGDIVIVSFGRGKPINLLGGGAVITNNAELTENLPIPENKTNCNLHSLFRYYSKITAYNVLIKPLVYGTAIRLPGLNIGETIYKPLTKISDFPVCARRLLNNNIKAYQYRTQHNHNMHARFANLNLPNLIDLPSATQHDFCHPLLRYPILILDKNIHDKLLSSLRALGASRMYGTPLSRIKGIPTSISQGQKTAPNAQRFSRQLLTLPTHLDVSVKVQDKIFSIIKNALN